MNVGDRIRLKRLEKGLAMDDLAKALGVTRQAIFKYENGIVSNIPIGRLQGMAKILGTSPSYLMGWDENPAPKDEKEHEKKLAEKDDKFLESLHSDDRKAKLFEWLAGLDDHELDRIEKILDAVELLPKE